MNADTKMSAAIPFNQPSRPGWLSAGVCLAAFFSPSAYFLLVVLAGASRIPGPPEALVVALFCLLPVVALLVCGYVVWLSSLTVARKIGWMFFSLLAMSLQVGIVLVVVRAILVTRIAYF